MVKMYSVVKKYICTITGSLCEEGGVNNNYRSMGCRGDSNTPDL